MAIYPESEANTRLERTKQFAKKIINIVFLNPLGLLISYGSAKLFFCLFRPKQPRLHLGCGTIKKEGYINIDHRFSRAVDLFLDIKRLPFPPESVSRIECYHVIEHIRQREIADTLDNWHGVLAKGGELVIECPNIDDTMKGYLAGNENHIYNIYGKDRFKGDIHYFGYNPERLIRLLENHGFDSCSLEEPTDYHKESEPCMRIVCRKRGNKNRCLT